MDHHIEKIQRHAFLHVSAAFSTFRKVTIQVFCGNLIFYKSDMGCDMHFLKGDSSFSVYLSGSAWSVSDIENHLQFLFFELFARFLSVSLVFPIMTSVY